uniref:IRF tryptophan pentad repeat domain-containing protein n=1 Tax=Pelusios castaneus TaxID=367368 RepID=A0A8C8RBA9_9SAUR
MPVTKLRMRPWLENQINSGQISGLQWINKKRMIFQVPWKHAAKQEWNIERDACLFQKWAIHTGKYRIGKPDPVTWKTNFCCAIYSLPDIVQLKDTSFNTGCAVRVYKMLSPILKLKKKQGLSLLGQPAKILFRPDLRDFPYLARLAKNALFIQ